VAHEYRITNSKLIPTTVQSEDPLSVFFYALRAPEVSSVFSGVFHLRGNLLSLQIRTIQPLSRGTLRSKRRGIKRNRLTNSMLAKGH
jgi:hypothetical protein